MLNIRKIQKEDLFVVCLHRRKMFEESGTDSAVLGQMIDSFAIWLTPHLEDGTYFGFMTEDESTIVAGIGLMLISWPPHPSHPTSDNRGYILNLYVNPSHRGRGIATDLMNLADNEFKARGVQYAILHSTNMGRPIYQKLGWISTSEMAKVL